MMIKGIEVRIPPPLDEPFGAAQLQIQNDFMQACMDAFADKEKPSFLESPEGTDRTVTLLSTALAWIDHQLKTQETQTNKILYLCGTNDECHRIIQEYKKRIEKNYDFEMKLLDFENISIFNQTDEGLQNKRDEVDSKEMTNAKENKWVVNPVIIFGTHNLFIEGIMSKSQKGTFSLKDTIVLVDDAHLIEETARIAMSASLSNCVFQTFEKDLEQGIGSGHELSDFAFQLKWLKAIFMMKPYVECYGFPSYSYKDLEHYLKPIHDSAPSLTVLKNFTNIDINNVNNILKFISHIFNFSALESELDSVKAYTSEDYFVGQHMHHCKEGSNCKTIQILCIDPSVLIKRILKSNASPIFTSATISPISGLKTELQIESSNDFTGKSFVEDFQIFCRIVSCGAGGYFLNSSFSTRDDKDYLTSLGKTVLEFSKVTPECEGVLVYFISASLLENCVSHWQIAKPAGQVTLWDEICKYKDIISISRKDDQDKVEKLNKEKGSCILTTIRGPIPEDKLSIQKKRVVIVVGVPFLYTKDPHLRLKKEYNKEKIRDKNLKFLSESQYEQREAYKLVNRVIDRQICSKSQYGVILLLDTRYRESELSPSIRLKIQREKRFHELIFELKDFFSHVKDRVSSTSVNEELVSTQFGGKVKKWEFEKSRLEYLKLKRQNDRYTGNKKYLENMLQEHLKANELLKEDLEKLKAQVPIAKTPVKREHPVSQSGSGTKIPKLEELQSPNTKEECSTNQAGGSSIVSPIKLSLEELHIQSPAKELSSVSQAEGANVRLVSPLTSDFSSKKRPYED